MLCIRGELFVNKEQKFHCRYDRHYMGPCGFLAFLADVYIGNKNILLTLQVEMNNVLLYNYLERIGMKLKVAHMAGSLFLPVLLCMVFIGCDSSDDSSAYYYNTSDLSSTAVTSFSLQNNSNILNNLDSVYFSINLNEGTIFNASPLPVGTRIDALIVNISTTNFSSAKLKFVTRWNNDTTVNYLTNTTDSINFANGPVTLSVVSYDGVNSRDYIISVNVFDENPDEMIWEKLYDTFPSELSDVESQKTVMCGDVFVCLSESNGKYYISTSAAPDQANSWNETVSVTLPSGDSPSVESLIGTESGVLYVLGSVNSSKNNVLYSSSDEGKTWVSTDVSAYSLFGCYEDAVIGSAMNDDGEYTAFQYPGDASGTILPDNFPVSGFSNTVPIVTEWGVTPIIILNGGKTKSELLTGDTWAYDGENWAMISATPMEAANGRTLIPYVYSETDTVSWRPVVRNVIFAIGGISADGDVINTVKYSADMGRHWADVPDGYSIPESFGCGYSAQAYIVDKILTPSSRAIAPITEWECPYIYYFGGIAPDGTQNRDVWRGVLRRLTLTPLE